MDQDRYTKVHHTPTSLVQDAQGSNLHTKANVIDRLNAYERKVKVLSRANDKALRERDEAVTGFDEARAQIERCEEVCEKSGEIHNQMKRSLKSARAETKRVRTMLDHALEGHGKLQARLDAQPEGPCEQQLRIIKQLRAQVEDSGLRPNVGPLTAPPVASFADILDELRGLGWVVAIHNDYRQGGEFNTFWMLTKHGHEVHGEGPTDLAALAFVRPRVKAVERRWEMGEAIDARHKGGE